MSRRPPRLGADLVDQGKVGVESLALEAGEVVRTAGFPGYPGILTLSAVATPANVMD